MPVLRIATPWSTPGPLDILTIETRCGRNSAIGPGKKPLFGNNRENVWLKPFSSRFGYVNPV